MGSKGSSVYIPLGHNKRKCKCSQCRLWRKEDDSKRNEMAKKLWEAEVAFYGELFKLADESPRDATLMLIESMQSKLNTIKFSLIDRFEIDGIKESELGWSEVDPLICLNIYIDGIIRKLLWLRQIAPYRRTEINKLRKEYRKKKKDGL